MVRLTAAKIECAAIYKEARMRFSISSVSPSVLARLAKAVLAAATALLFVAGCGAGSSHRLSARIHGGG